MNVVQPLPGTRFGNYEIQSLIGSGGMARVYRAYDHNLQRPVAIKLITEAAAAEPGVAARFQQEARFIARLRHPHIVQVYDFGEVDGLAYMVQELLPGPTLEQELHDQIARGGHVSRDELCSTISQLAMALDAAHGAGIIHRDVKPSNAMRNIHGQLILTDFGIARLTQPDAAHTQAGMVIGTPDYISPEQAQGLPPTTASDIYALGVVLYELITGQRPFTAATPMGVVLGHIQQQPPSLLPLRPDMPPAVEAVVLRALAKDPSQRFRSAGQLAQALEQAWPAGVVAAIHSAPTTAWSPPPTATTATLSAIPTQVVKPVRPNPVVPPTAIPNPAAPVSARPRLPLLAILGGLLVLLLVGAAIAARGGSETQATLPAASAAVEPTAPAEPTAVPAEPAPAPASPFERLRALLQNAVANNQIEDGNLLEQLASAEAAVAAGDSGAAIEQLRELRATVGDSEGIPLDIRQSALDDIAQIAITYGLVLDAPAEPTPVPENPDNGNGNGENKDKDKGKGKNSS